MTPKKIILLRHGQTDFNRRGIVQGNGIDSSLNETGLAQAVAFYEAYRDYGFEQLFTSALKRTRETVAQFIEEQLPWTTLEDLNEMNWGIHEGQPALADGDESYYKLLNRWQAGEIDYRVENGESPIEVSVRLGRALDVIKQSEARKVLVCTHGRAMRIFLCMTLNRSLTSMDLFEHRNACVYELLFDGVNFKLLKGNDVEHLEAVDSGMGK